MCKHFPQIPMYQHNHCLLLFICCAWIPFIYFLILYVWGRIYHTLFLLIQLSGFNVTKPCRISSLTTRMRAYSHCFYVGKALHWISLGFLQLTPKTSITNNQSKDSYLYYLQGMK